MSSSSNPNLSDEILRRIDQACDDFESAWKSGERPFVDDVLGDFPEAAQGPLLNELLPIEIAWRLKSGETPTADSYLFRFPMLDPVRLEALLGSESTVAPDDPGTLAITDSELLGEFDSEVFDVSDSADSFNELAVECAEFLRSLDGLGIVDARHVLRLLADSGQPLDQVSPAEVLDGAYSCSDGGTVKSEFRALVNDLKFCGALKTCDRKLPDLSPQDPQGNAGYFTKQHLTSKVATAWGTGARAPTECW